MHRLVTVNLSLQKWKIIKIGQYLPKLCSNKKWSSFLDPQRSCKYTYAGFSYCSWQKNCVKMFLVRTARFFPINGLVVWLGSGYASWDDNRVKNTDSFSFQIFSGGISGKISPCVLYSHGFFTLILVYLRFLSASLYFSKRGAYWDRLCRDVVGRWLLVGCHARALWPNGAS